jgi:nitrite reductase/ring-hydroxylating ferredoxin subunit
MHLLHTRPFQKLDLSRRNFLNLAWKGLLGLSGLLGLAGLCRYFSYQPYPAPAKLFDLGPVPDIPVGTRIEVPAAQAILVSTEEGLKAFSLICPHLGCEVETDAEGFVCPCHGSRFNEDGSLKKGPASEPLRPLRLEVSKEGHLILDIS